MLMNNRRVLTLVAGLAALALSACSGVGDGNSLQSLVIVSSANTAVSFDDLEAGGDTEAQAYQCLAGGLTLYGLFNKNDSAGEGLVFDEGFKHLGDACGPVVGG